MTKITEKKCTGPCGLIKPLSEFNVHKTSASGYDYRCKPCKSEYNKEYCKNNNVILKAKKKVFRQKNKESIAKYALKWCQENPDYHSKYRKKNEAEKKEYGARYRASHLDMVRAKSLKHYYNNKDAIRIKQAKYRRENAHTIQASGAKRRADKLQRTPVWADLEAIKQVYADCIEINLAAATAGCSERFSVDHIVPLVSKLVSGLHVEYNLQIITIKENCSKGNRFTPG